VSENGALIVMRTKHTLRGERALATGRFNRGQKGGLSLAQRKWEVERHNQKPLERLEPKQRKGKKGGEGPHELGGGGARGEPGGKKNRALSARGIMTKNEIWVMGQRTGAGQDHVG